MASSLCLSNSSNASLRKSATCWQLGDLAAMAEESSISRNQHTNSSPESFWKMQKPPRHSNVPMCAQMLLKLWQEVLEREDVCLTSDFFFDLNGDEYQGAYLVARMQEMGFNIAVTQFLSLRRCSIYDVLLVALQPSPSEHL